MRISPHNGSKVGRMAVFHLKRNSSRKNYFFFHVENVTEKKILSSLLKIPSDEYVAKLIEDLTPRNMIENETLAKLEPILQLNNKKAQLLWLALNCSESLKEKG
jgi:hypothetical protein